MSNLIESITNNYRKTISNTASLIDLDILIGDVKTLYIELLEKRKSLEDTLFHTSVTAVEPVHPFIEDTKTPLIEVEPKNEPTSPLIEELQEKFQEPEKEEVILDLQTLSDHDQATYDKASVLFDGYVSDHKVASNPIKQPIKDIKASISLNDKFKYLKDLFDNKIELYNNSIDELNSCQTADEAGTLFVDLMTKFGWEYTNPSVLSLFELVELRYMQ